MKLSYVYLLMFLVIAILFSCTANAQQQFPIGTFKTQFEGPTFNGYRYNPALYDTFVSSGMNWFYYHIDDGTKQLLKSRNINNVIGGNNDGPQELIKHYGSSHYSKWQAEENQTNANSIGVKHKYGDTATWKGVNCWSSKGLTSAKDSLMYGPHYYQEKIYHRYYYNPWQERRDIQYIARFSMALDYDSQLVSQNEKVCVIKVVNRYNKYTLISPDNWRDDGVFDSVFRVDTLTVSRFNNNGTFRFLKFEERPNDYYMYDTSKYSAGYGKPSNPLLRNSIATSEQAMYLDVEAGTGIQFCVDWLRNDTLCTLYIDFAEVFDVNGWKNYIEDPGGISDSIKAYANAQVLNFPNLKYFEGGTEQASIDCIIPHKIVDSLVFDTTQRRLWLGLTIATPLYWPLYNGIKLYEKIYDEVQLKSVLIKNSLNQF